MTTDKLHFYYIKSNHYRVVHADGAYGGGTPRGQFFFSVYNERVPIPQITTHKIVDQALGEELAGERKGKKGVIREIEVGVIMSIAEAEAFHKWLGESVATVKKQVQEAMAAKEKKPV